MGTTLFSCQYTDGKKKRIENVVVIDTLKKAEKEVELIIPNKNSTPTSIKRVPILENIANEVGIVEVIETTGEITIDGDTEFVDPSEKNEEVEDEAVFGIIIEEPPRFKETEKVSKEEIREDFDELMRCFF
jgi:hypothetical protein